MASIEVMSDAIQKIVKNLIISSSPIGAVIYNSIEKSGEVVKSAEGKSIEEFALEVRKQEMQMEFAKHQAKVSQELAIANRINNALVVEIEEFYQKVGKGKAGLSMDGADGLTLGVAGEAHRVTRRIYRFKGNASQSDELVCQQLDEIEKNLAKESEEKPQEIKDIKEEQ